MELEKMSVDQLHSSACREEITWRDGFNELDRRLKEADAREANMLGIIEDLIFVIDDKPVGTIVEDAKQAISLASPRAKQMLAVEKAAQNILIHFSPEHLDSVSGSSCGTDLARALK